MSVIVVDLKSGIVALVSSGNVVVSSVLTASALVGTTVTFSRVTARRKKKIDKLKLTIYQIARKVTVSNTYIHILRIVPLREGRKPENPEKNPRSTGEINYTTTLFT